MYADIMPYVWRWDTSTTLFIPSCSTALLHDRSFRIMVHYIIIIMHHNLSMILLEPNTDATVFYQSGQVPLLNSGHALSDIIEPHPNSSMWILTNIYFLQNQACQIPPSSKNRELWLADWLWCPYWEDFYSVEYHALCPLVPINLSCKNIYNQQFNYQVTPCYYSDFGCPIILYQHSPLRSNGCLHNSPQHTRDIQQPSTAVSVYKLPSTQMAPQHLHGPAGVENLIPKLVGSWH